MNKEDRHKRILELLNVERELNVAFLAQELGVSEMTIRKDLTHLSNVGLLVRTYGGAVAPQFSGLEMSLIEKQNEHLEEKALIGKLVASLIEKNESIMLDSGITTQQVAKNLLNHQNLTVITNGLNILNTLSGHANITLYTVGGSISANSYTIMGPGAEADFMQYYARTSIISVDSVDIERGLTSRNQLEANISRILVNHAERKILVCDFSKLNHISLIPVCPLSAINIIVTDSRAPADFVERARALGIQVLIP